jgi:hypothetical protein
VDEPAVNPDDHAVVIAIRRYADVKEGWITELRGPDNDAAAVSNWLKSPEGGGLLDDNVNVVWSAEAPEPPQGSGGVPNQEAVVSALDEIAQLPKNRYDHQYAGRRLYVYISGHGWAREPHEAALVTAEATKANPLNVLVTSWTRWMHKAATFRELVLWADTCATRASPKALRPCVLTESMSANHPKVRLFEGFAAPLGQRAVENEMSDGQWHGAFTYALLEGLNGAAPSPVTSDALSDYLRNAMKEFIGEEDRKRKTVAQEPTFGRSDDIVFVTRPRAAFPVTLRFAPDCLGRRVTVGTSRTNPPVADTVLEDADWNIELEAGVWGAFVEDSQTTKLFEVAGGGVDSVVTVP